jgi:hypothetical protein
MGSIATLPNGLAYLTQPGGLLSNLPSSISASDLQSASPQDIVSLSVAAIQAQQVEGLFGVSASSGTTATSILPGVSSADLTNATAQQKAALNDQALLLQQTQALFDPQLPTSASLNLSA